MRGYHIEYNSEASDALGVRVLRGVVTGLAAGIVATWVMTQFQTAVSQALSGRQDETKEHGQGGDNRQEQEEPATVKAAQAFSKSILDRPVPDDQKETAGTIAHYAMGAVSGSIYGGLAEVVPSVSRGSGIPFGGALWLMADDLIVPALGLSKWPTAYPPSRHAYALGAHLVYGLTTDLVRRSLRAVL